MKPQFSSWEGSPSALLGKTVEEALSGHMVAMRYYREKMAPKKETTITPDVPDTAGAAGLA